MGSRRSKSQVTGFQYSFDVHMGLARGPLDQIAVVRVGDREIWNASGETLGMTGDAPPNVDIRIEKGGLFGGPDREGGIIGSLKLFFGAASQIVDSDVKARLGGLVSNWRGVTTAFYSGVVATNNPYPKSWAFRVRRALCGWDGSVWYPQKARVYVTGSSGIDLFQDTVVGMNGAHILYECITNRVWGRGTPRSMINEESFVDAANKLCDEGFALCMVWDRKSDLDDFVGMVINHIGGALYLDRFTGLWTLRLIRDDYDVNALPTFDYNSGLLGIEEDESGTREGAINEVVVEYFDVPRKSKASVREQDPAGFATRGAIRSVTAQYPGIPTAELALRVAARDLRAQALNLRRFKLRMDRRAWNIAPASVIKISVPSRGITSMVVRVAKVTDTVITDGTIILDVVQDVFGLPATSFNSVGSGAWVPPPSTVPPSPLYLTEANWLDLSRTLSSADLEQIEDDESIVIGYAVTPGSLALDFTYETSLDGTSWTPADASPFAASVSFISPLAHDTTNLTLSASPPGGSLPVNAVGRITEEGVSGEEIVSVVSYDPETREVVLRRGCADTPPRAWTTSAICIFYLSAYATDNVEYVAGETVYGRAVARSYSAVAAPSDEVSLTTANRLGRPYAPGDVRINGEPFWTPYADLAAPVYPLTITWAGRNRLTQRDVAVGHDEPATTPEAGTSYTLRIFNDDTDSLIRTISGITAETVSYDPTSYSDTLPSRVRYELRSVRGSVESFYPVSFVLDSSAGTGGFNRNFNNAFNGG